MSVYLIPRHPVQVEYDVKKSRFIARAARASTREEAMAQLEEAKRDYPDARHHCWAYLLGNAVSAAMSDDGEPSGTAGKPILNVLQHKGVGDIMLIVIRYFGGIKLGAGGLVRAYSTAAQMAMDALPTQPVEPLCEGVVVCDFGKEQMVRHWLTQHEGDVLTVEYQQSARLQVRFGQTHEADWQAFLQREQLTFTCDPSARPK